MNANSGEAITALDESVSLALGWRGSLFRPLCAGWQDDRSSAIGVDMNGYDRRETRAGRIRPAAVQPVVFVQPSRSPAIAASRLLDAPRRGRFRSTPAFPGSFVRSPRSSVLSAFDRNRSYATRRS
uniref:Uncharacterized protein n=1 Tax=Plectus sambesii TaxID=2011161 RepID=A0A914V129_9BILA